MPQVASGLYPNDPHLYLELPSGLSQGMDGVGTQQRDLDPSLGNAWKWEELGCVACGLIRQAEGWGGFQRLELSLQGPSHPSHWQMCGVGRARPGYVFPYQACQGGHSALIEGPWDMILHLKVRQACGCFGG